MTPRTLSRSIALALALLTLPLTACGTMEETAATPAPDTAPAVELPTLAALPSVEVPMPPAQPMTDGLTRSVELAPGALHVWVAPSIGGADMMVWTDATPTPQALPAGAEFDATAWATRVYVRSQDGQPVATMTGTIRYEYAQL